MTTTAAIDKGRDPETSPRMVIVAAYLGIIVALPVYGFWRAFVPIDVVTLLLLQSGLLAASFVLAAIWTPLRPLRGFFVIALAMGLLPTLLAGLVLDIGPGATIFDDTRFLSSQTGTLIWKALVCLAMIGLLLAIGLRRRAFFLTTGDLDAVSRRERWLPGMKADETWKRSGRNVTVVVFVLGLVLLLGLNVPRLGFDNLIKAVPLLPFALLYAAVNAFYEELTFRAAPMSQLAPAVGDRHTLLITSIFFGLGHFIGSVPDGFVGVAFAGYLALIMGKAMLETRGIVWPWIIHFVVDVPIFILLAVSAEAAGLV